MFVCTQGIWIPYFPIPLLLSIVFFKIFILSPLYQKGNIAFSTVNMQSILRYYYLFYHMIQFKHVLTLFLLSISLIPAYYLLEQYIVKYQQIADTHKNA